MQTNHSQLALFTEEEIRYDAIILQDGGSVVTSFKNIPQEHKGYGVVIAKGLYLIPSGYSNKENISYLNHSCDPNVKRIGNCIYVAKKKIFAGDELTIDYATLTAGQESWTLSCVCKKRCCRKVITGNDWMIPKLAKELWSEWLPIIQKEILRRNVL